MNEWDKRSLKSFGLAIDLYKSKGYSLLRISKDSGVTYHALRKIYKEYNTLYAKQK